MTLSAFDRLEILDVLARADSAASRRDVEGYLAYFTSDAVLDGAMGEHRGKEQLRGSVGPIWEAEGSASVHLTLNAVVDPVGAELDRAVATSTLMVLHEASPISIQSISTVVQHLVKAGPDWRIERRTVHSVLAASG
jgi:hypothetical protein